MKAFIALLLTFTCSFVYADNVGYEVEVIIFEDSTGVYNYSEQWDLMQEDKLEQQVPAKPSKKTKVERHFSTINNAKAFRLTDQAEKLAKHPDFNVLVHKSWKQAGLDRDFAFEVHVDSNDDKASKKATADANVNTSTSRISGDLKLIMSRYLHINTDLVYEKVKPGQSITPGQEGYQPSNDLATYPLNFERRMRSREIHYIDHPLVGIIVLATPYKLNSEEETKPAEYKTI